MPQSESKLSTEEVCRTYFETQIFGIGGVGDLSELGFFAKAGIDLKIKDASFKAIDDEDSTTELIAANIELYGLAWINHQLESDPVSRNNPTDEISFTKNYLTQVGRGDVWERMDAYNTSLAAAIADSVVSNHYGRFRDLPDPTDDEGYKQQRDKELLSLAKPLTEEFARHLSDGECVKRLMVRYLTASPGDLQRITHVTQNISLVFADRLDWSPDAAGLFALQRIIVGLYENAVAYLGEVREFGSFEASNLARKDLLEALVKWAQDHEPDVEA